MTARTREKASSYVFTTGPFHKLPWKKFLLWLRNGLSNDNNLDTMVLFNIKDDAFINCYVLVSDLKNLLHDALRAWLWT